jgi:ornithine cyclodeaminase
MIRLVRRRGVAACIAGVAERIRREFLRWDEFDKSARMACHSELGVIELMPIADASQFAFKYVNGTRATTATGCPP